MFVTRLIGRADELSVWSRPSLEANAPPGSLKNAGPFPVHPVDPVSNGWSGDRMTRFVGCFELSRNGAIFRKSHGLAERHTDARAREDTPTSGGMYRRRDSV